MAKRMLIDATHPEETRVVVLNGNRLEEFDFESSTKKQVKGNIYLAKVTRVEPSLQAAFVEYGGNRHGFLAFSEIHPDYFRIPVGDREADGDADRPRCAQPNRADDGEDAGCRSDGAAGAGRSRRGASRRQRTTDDDDPRSTTRAPITASLIATSPIAARRTSDAADHRRAGVIAASTTRPSAAPAREAGDAAERP